MANIVKKNVNYLGRDFNSLRDNMLTFIKSYYPDIYKDFNDASPGMMLVELAAYVGDVMGFYLDAQFKELYLDTAEQRKNVINLARMMGYIPPAAVSSTTQLDLYLVVPATGSAGNKYPDYRYTPTISKGMTATSNTNPPITFETTEDVNFSQMTSSLNNLPTELSIFETDDNNIPTKFLLRKKTDVISGETVSFDQAIGDPQKYLKIQLPSRTISEVINVVDADGNKWYQVDSLAQDTVFIEQQNTTENDPELVNYSGSVPYLMKLKKVPKRYQVITDENNFTYILFGSGITNSNDEELIPNPSNVGTPFLNTDNKYDYAIDPENFLKTKTFGEAPSNTTLTITYREGGGINTNVPPNTIITPGNASFTFPVNESILDNGEIADIKNSLGCNNQEPATGGKGNENIESIKRNAVANLRSQKRCVTKEDYIVRAYSLPSKFGSLAKVYVEKDDSVRTLNRDDLITDKGVAPVPQDPLALNMYVLSYDYNHNLIAPSVALKNNLKTYISQYRMLTDTLNIVNGKIINIQVYFEIIVTNKHNKNDTLIKAINALEKYFAIDNWNFNQPIIYSKVYEILNKIDEVQSVPSIKIVNKAGGNYSSYAVDLKGLKRKGIIYPPRDVCIFEVKFPKQDFIGSAS